jgi:hypothetical protein
MMVALIDQRDLGSCPFQVTYKLKSGKACPDNDDTVANHRKDLFKMGIADFRSAKGDSYLLRRLLPNWHVKMIADPL